MKILILRSIKNTSSLDRYSMTLDTAFADRILGHLSDQQNFCSVCGKTCMTCRKDYHLNFSGQMAGVIGFTAVLPALLEHPEELLPDHVPDHDILLAMAVHEEVLIAFVERFSQSQGLIIPIEDSDWISPYAIQKIEELCRRTNRVVAFPKPFCDFNPTDGILADFKKMFKIGQPEIKYTVQDGIITAARVVTSAPCGATYYTARNLVGQRVDRRLEYTIDNSLSAYPCTASTAVDREFHDSIIHQAVKIQHHILAPLLV